MLLNLTEKEIEDVRRGLIIAMQELDKSKGKPDELFSDRLEKIHDKIVEQTL